MDSSVLAAESRSPPREEMEPEPRLDALEFVRAFLIVLGSVAAVIALFLFLGWIEGLV